jgi:pre-mRNA-splicing helicase BRR2
LLFLVPQVLIFVHSRKETAKTALYLKQTALDNDHLAKFMRDDSASREILQVGVQAVAVLRKSLRA